MNDRKVFYRQASDASAPTILLLHGFPSSSFMFRELIPQLADRFHVIAPDYIGFGQSDAPPADAFDYTFNNLTAHVTGLIDQSGSPPTFSICMITAARRVSYSDPEAGSGEGLGHQNANAHMEGVDGPR